MDINAILSNVDKLFAEGKIEAARDYLLEMLSKAEESNRYDIYISLCNELAGFYRVSGKKSECYNILDKALLLLKKNNLTENVAYVTTLLNQATAYSAFGDTEKALEIYKFVEIFYNKTLKADDFRFASLYNNISFALLKTNNKEDALSYLKKSMAILQGLKDTEIEQATCHTNIGQITTALKLYDEAEYHLNCAHKLFNRMQVFDVHYDALLSALGNLKFKQERFEDSAMYFEKAAESTQSKFGKNYNYRLICKNCILAWESSGNTEKALLWQREMGDD